MEDPSNIEVSGPALRHLARMICGDEPYNGTFPYRSSSYLTSFFTELFLDYEHDGSTRARWVQRVLEDLAEIRGDEHGDPHYYLTRDLGRVILHVIDPIQFHGSGDYETALERMDEVLRHTGLALHWNEQTGAPELVEPEQGAVSLDQTRKILTDALVVHPRVFTPPSSADYDSPLVSVMMPYGDPFDEVYENHLKPAIEGAGFQCRRADEAWEADVVIDDIVHLIHNSAAVVVDITDKNPNVFYELGITHTFGRPVLLISQDGTDLPFNIQHHRCIQYSSDPEGLSRLSADLEKRLNAL